MIHTNITKDCYGYWSQCPYKVEKSKCEVYRDCLYDNQCFKEWRLNKGQIATEDVINRWDI